eukprot:scaffold102221_cov57-Phaeocystis_antarctica.AAC.1
MPRRLTTPLGPTSRLRLTTAGARLGTAVSPNEISTACLHCHPAPPPSGLTTPRPQSHGTIEAPCRHGRQSQQDVFISENPDDTYATTRVDVYAHCPPSRIA